MHIAAVVLSVLLAAELAFTGIIKILGTGTARANAAHLGITLRSAASIGIAELAAVAGLLAGLAVKPLTIVPAAAVALLRPAPSAITSWRATMASHCFPR